MLKRTAWNDLLNWKKSKAKKALLIKGARQIGKTTLVREFARQNYEQLAEINFLEDEQAKRIFDGSLDPNTIISNLTAHLRLPLPTGKTLVLLDEIQECPRARTAIKFLVEDGRFDYIETGSLLGVKTKDVPSYPVGFEEHLAMYPLCFEEFCLANGVQRSTLNTLRTSFEQCTPVPEAMHRTMMQLFYVYAVVGGMPEVVQRYTETHDIAQVVSLQEDLLALYRLDIAKYAATSEKTKVRDIFDAIPAQLDDKNRRFVLTDLGKNARQNRYASSFLWLADAGVALPCYNVQQPVVPLEANERHSLFKLFLCDTGLLCAASLSNAQFELLNGNLDINMGAIAENLVAQELKSQGFDLCYYNSKRHGEIDFIVQNGKRVMPIEVKSGNDWTNHKALDNILSVEEWGLESAFALCKGNVSQQGCITYLPLYMSMFLQPTPLPNNTVFEVDMSALR